MPSNAPVAPVTLVSKFAERIQRQSRWRGRLIVMGFGMLGACALPPLHLLPLLVPAFAGLIWSFAAATRRRAAFGAGWWFGFGYFVAGLYWLAIPLTLDLVRFGWMIPFAVFGISGVLALFTGLATWITHETRLGGAARVLMLAAAWGGAEWLRGYVLTGFPWNLTATAWTATPAMIQSAALYGAYGLSAITVAICAMPALLGDQHVARTSAFRWIAGAVVALAAIWIAGMIRLATAENGTVDGVRLRIVQGNIAQSLKWDPARRQTNFDTYLRLTNSEGFNRITHVIWPETAIDFRFQTRFASARLGSANEARLRAAIPAAGLLITGAVRDQTGKAYNSVHAIDSSGAIVATYDKHHLVPFGEFVPLRGVLGALGIEKIVHGRGDFDAGPGPRTLTHAKLPPVSPLVCYEAIFPGSVASRRSRPMWLLNVTNDAWFGHSSGPYQHLASARLRAVEEGLPLVRAANTGISAIIDAYGRELERLDLGKRGTIDGGLPKAIARTPYGRFGDWMLLVVISLLAAAAFIARATKWTRAS